MNKTLQTSLSIAALVAAFSISFVCWRLSVALDSWGNDGAQTFTGLNQALETINRPCGGGHPCGTLANLDKMQVKIGDLLVTSQLQERDIAKAAQANMAAVNGLADHLNKTADALAETSQAATGTLNQAQVDFGTLNTTIAGLQPLEASLTGTAAASTATINTFNGRLSDPHIDSLMASFDSMSKSSVGIVADGKTLSDYVTKQVTTPRTFMQKVEGYSGDGFDIAAYLARHYR
jgi:hypothetical protein